MRKTFHSFIVVLALLCAACSHNKAMTVKEEYKTSENKSVTMSVIESPLLRQYEDYKNKNAEVKEVEDRRPYIDEVDSALPADLLNYIWNKSNETGLSYEMLLAISKVESDFNPKLISSTNDFGLFQIHKPTDKWISQELGLTNYNLKNPKTNLDFAVYYLSYLRDVWRQEGASEEDVFDLTIISFNRGVSGTNNYLKHRNIDDNTYLKRVREWKSIYEQKAVVS